jgi:outer membrane protein OmpA-like peptidoglycan-associated protein
MVAKTRILGFVLAAIALLAAGQGYAQNELRNTFFKEADAAKAAAEAVDAQLLAPRSYERGLKEYTDAETALERGRNIETVRSNAADAAAYFTTATEKAQIAKTSLALALKSRQDAANARAPQLSADIWEQAQRKFGEAIRLLERGDLKGSERRKIEATTLYRDAELVAIKAEYLSETRRLLQDADRARVGRYAPITLGRAKQLLADAERELNENRYDTDQPRSLAVQANYEAKHAIYLSEIVRKVRDKDLTAEQIVLQWEDSMRQIAGVADISPDMQNGPDKLTAELVAYFENERNELQALQQESAENAIRIADMEEEMRALRVKQQFEQVEKMFTSDEARVFRQGNNIIMRLVGLNFDSGASQIKPENFDLLAKVEKAIDVFPRSELIIEGHTDSFGGDDLNQKLSQERAESVQQYMINAMRIPTYRLIATGYGETRPVASNETEAGRARNRRIDIVIKPSSDPG